MNDISLNNDDSNQVINLVTRNNKDPAGENGEILKVNGGTESNLSDCLENRNRETLDQSAGSAIVNLAVHNANTTNIKSKKRKKILRDETAPKQPLTGYFRFLNDRREKVRLESPSKPFAEITRQLAAEWNTLDGTEKQQYLDAAEQDKERYIREFNDYKQTEAYKIFVEKQAAEKKKKLNKEKEKEQGASKEKDKEKEKDRDKDKNGSINNESSIAKKAPRENSDGNDIPIFTEEFLEHNKACEAELRQLRKTTTDYESQNAVLQRHVDSLHTAINQLESDTNNQRSTNVALQRHLDTLRSELSTCFSNIRLAGVETAIDNIDNYISRIDYLLGNNIDYPTKTNLQFAISRLDIVK